MPRAAALAAPLLALLLLLGCAVSAVVALVNTPLGTFNGVYDAAYDVDAYLGVRFAVAQRWQRPQFADAVFSNGVYNATSVHLPCPQLGSPFNVRSTDEDCLFLNIYVPRGGAAIKPVYMFFPGGSFEDIDPPLYNSVEFDGASLARARDMIVVTGQYRVGVFGFITVPAGDPSSKEATNVLSNFGLYDQRQALMWVNSNISYFGGNQSQVTLAGQSAGSISVCLHLVIPTSAGLFAAVDMQSGACFNPLPVVNTQLDQFDYLRKKFGCGQCEVSCLDKVSTDALLNVSEIMMHESAFPFQPAIDQDLIPAEPVTLMYFGTFNRVPVLMGSTRNEGSLFFNHASALEYYKLLTVFSILAPQVEAEYPLNASNPSTSLQAAFGDFSFNCNVFATATLLAKHTPVYMYYWTKAPHLDPVSYFGPNYRAENNSIFGAFHTSGLPFIFGNARLTPEEVSLSNAVRNYWGSFFATGDPNLLSSMPTRWPLFTEDTGYQMLVVDSNFSIATGPAFLSEHHCEFWYYLRPPAWIFVVTALFVIVVVIGVIVGAVFGSRRAQKRRAAFLLKEYDEREAILSKSEQT